MLFLHLLLLAFVVASVKGTWIHESASQSKHHSRPQPTAVLPPSSSHSSSIRIISDKYRIAVQPLGTELGKDIQGVALLNSTSLTSYSSTASTLNFSHLCSPPPLFSCTSPASQEHPASLNPPQTPARIFKTTFPQSPSSRLALPSPSLHQQVFLRHPWCR